MRRAKGVQKFYKMLFLAHSYTIGCYAYTKDEAFSNLLYLAKSLGFFPLLYSIHFESNSLTFVVNNVSQSVDN